MDILHASRPAARVTRLQSHLQQLLRTTAASWGLDPLAAGTVAPGTARTPARGVLSLPRKRPFSVVA